MEAYHSVYNYHVISIVETHLGSAVDEEKLAQSRINGYRFVENVERRGIGLYVNNSLRSNNSSTW